MTETKYFTPNEAKMTLPLVKKIVKDILDTTKEIRLLVEDLDGQIESNDQIKKMITDINGFMYELEELGCFYKDWNFTVGLVDFPSYISGEEVYLCWRSDEEDIRYYHSISEGYAGRKLIPQDYLNN